MRQKVRETSKEEVNVSLDLLVPVEIEPVESGVFVQGLEGQVNNVVHQDVPLDLISSKNLLLLSQELVHFHLHCIELFRFDQ